MPTLSRRHPAAAAVTFALLALMLIQTALPPSTHAADTSGNASIPGVSLSPQTVPVTDKAKGSPITDYDIRVMGGATFTGLVNSSVAGGAPSLAPGARSSALAMRAGFQRLQASVPDAAVTFSQVVGAPETVIGDRTALSQAAPGKSGASIVQDYLRANRGLYGLTDAQIGALHFLGESKSPSGLRMVRAEQRVNGAAIFDSETRFILDREGRVWRTLGSLIPDGVQVARGKTLSAADAWRASMAAVDLTVAPNAVRQDGSNGALSTSDPRIMGEVSNTPQYFVLAPGLLVPAWGQVTYTNGDADWYTLVEARTGTVLWRKNIRNNAEARPTDATGSSRAVSTKAAPSAPAAWQQMQARTKATGTTAGAVTGAPSGTTVHPAPLAASTQEARFRVYVQADGITPADSPAPLSPTTAGPGVQAPEIAPSIVQMSTAQNITASPNGWIDDNGTTTTGNNVDAYLDRVGGVDADIPDAGALDNNGRPIGNPDTNSRNRDFLGTSPRDFSGGFLPPPQGGNPEAGQTASGGPSPALDSFRRGVVTQLFYTVNWFHDQMVALGFDEAAGNFQQTNFSGQGAGGDRVLAEAQDSAGVNDANFSTPPDGLSGRLQMYIYTSPTIARDSSLDAERVIHELAHGVPERLVADTRGLFWGVGRGLTEGWADFYALSLLNNTNADDPNGRYAFGAYASYKFGGSTDNYTYGIRRFPYTTDNSVNPLTWADIDDVTYDESGGIPASPLNLGAKGAFENHNVGELWALSLWEVRSRIIADPEGANGDVPTGNRTMLQLVTDSLKMMPPHPSLIDARDALVGADYVTNHNANEDAIWEGFADRGLGYGAIAPLSKMGTQNMGHMSVGPSTDLPHLDIANVSIDDSLGNNNGAVDPGERIKLNITLLNPWRDYSKRAGGTATLSTTTAGVTLTSTGATYAPITPQSTGTSNVPFIFSLDPNQGCSTSLKFNLSVVGALGTASIDFTLRVGKRNGTDPVRTFSQPIVGGKLIPDGAPRGVQTTLQIPDDLEIADLDYRVDNITHGNTSDLSVLLRGPNGFGGDLIWRRGWKAGQYAGANFVNTVIDETSPNDLGFSTAGQAPFTGTWAPAFDSPVGTLARYNELSTQGAWTTLVASFVNDLQQGTLNGWSLLITPTHFDCTVFRGTDVYGTKTVTGSFTPNGQINYTITLKNLGANPQADNAGNEFTDVLPADLTLVSATATAGTAVATVGTNTVTWNGALAALNGSVTITIVATINADASAKTISNQGTIAYDGKGNSVNESSRLTDDPAVDGTTNATVFTVGNNPPIANNDTYSIDEDTQYYSTLPGVLGNDTDDQGDTLTAVIVTEPTHASSFALYPTGVFAYLGAANYNGSDSFTYQVRDNHGALSAVATVNLTVEPVNDVPTAVDAGTAVWENSTSGVSIDLSRYVTDLETANANLTYVIDTPPGNGTLSGSGNQRTYKPNTNYDGTDTFTYHVVDRGDPDNCEPPAACAAAASSPVRTFSIRVAPVADLSLQASAAPPLVVAGQVVRYTYIASNAGPASAAAASLVVTLPDGVTASTLPEGCTSAATVTCDLGTIAKDATVTRIIPLTVGSALRGRLSILGKVSSSTGDLTVSNNHALASSTVIAPPTLTTLTPSWVPAGRGAMTLYLAGGPFVHGATVQWNGTPRPTVWLSPGLVRATLSDADLAHASVAQVTVTEPDTVVTQALPFTVAAPPPPNQVRNPSFEYPGSNASGAVLWNSVGAVSRDTAVRYSGSAALRLTPSSSTEVLAVQDVYIPGGDLYFLGARVLAQSASPRSNFLLDVQWIDESGRFLGTSLGQPLSLSTSGWASSRTQIQAPQSARRARVRVHVAGAGAVVFVDDVTLQVVNRLENANFEARPELVGWTGDSHVSWVDLGATGGQIQMMANDGSTSEASQSIIITQPGVVYNVGAWVAITGINPVDSFTVSVQWYDKLSELLSEDTIGTLTDATGGTKLVASSVMVPTGTVYGRLRLKANNLQGTVWVDNVFFQPGSFLLNGGFEQDTNRDGNADSWTNDGEVEMSAVARHSGVTSILLTGSGTSAGIAQIVPGVQPSQRYLLQGNVYIPVGTTLGSFRADVEWLNSSGTVVATSNAGVLNTATGAWRKLEAVVAMPASAASARVHLSATNLQGSVYLDDLSLQGANLTANNSFEADANADNRPDNWGVGGNATRSTALARAGAASARLAGTPALTALVRQDIPNIVANREYSFWTWVHVPDGATGVAARVEVQWYNSTSSLLGTSVLKTITGPTSNWAEVFAMVEAPAGAVRGRFQIVSTGGTQPLYADDVWVMSGAKRTLQMRMGQNAMGAPSTAMLIPQTIVTPEFIFEP